MNGTPPVDYFPMRKGALLLLAILLSFSLLLFAVHLWYSMQLASIECAIHNPIN